MYGINWEEGEVGHKYKVGDRIRVVKDAWGTTFPVGEFGHITDVLGRGVCAAREGGDGYGWFFSFSHVEPAPAEQGRFRVGDRVRVVKREEGNPKWSYHHESIGSIFTLKEWSGNFWRTNGSDFYPHEIAPAFQPGDRVRLNKHRDLHACGDRGTVKRVFGDNVEVEMDLSVYGSRSYVFPSEYLDWIRDEPAPDCAGRKVEPAANEPAKQKLKFNAGDVVRCVTGGFPDFTNGKTYTVEEFPDKYGYVSIAADDVGKPNGLHPEYFELAPAEQPCIVARVDNGQPKPAASPLLHASVADATAEAERLARNNPGKEFAVYQRVAGRVAEVSYKMNEVA